MEADLSKINWNPHSCGCKFTYLKTVTEYIEPEIFPWKPSLELHKRFAGKMGHLRLLVNDEDRVMVHVPRYATTLQDATKIIWRTEHGLEEFDFSPGVRIRSVVDKACKKHAGIEGVLQAQIATCPQVCRCRWFQLFEGAHTKDVYFGHRVIETCINHAGMPLKDIPRTVLDLAKQVKPEPIEHLEVKWRDGRVVFLHQGVEVMALA